MAKTRKEINKESYEKLMDEHFGLFDIIKGLLEIPGYKLSDKDAELYNNTEVRKKRRQSRQAKV